MILISDYMLIAAFVKYRIPPGSSRTLSILGKPRCERYTTPAETIRWGTGNHGDLERSEMPRLAKGGKWVYGWVIISAERKMPIPPEAWREYGFHAGDQVLLLRGSRRSGGFGIGTPERIAGAGWQRPSIGQLEMGTRVLGQARLDRDGSVALPPAIEAKPGDRLLAVQGSRLALDFIARGTIYEEAARHPELVELS
jgi:hypothetical protein